MKIVNAQQMREIDRVTIEEYGIPSLVLMERAGLAVVRRVKELFDGSKKIIILSGGGNNGGDGLVVARNLHNEGWVVKVYLTSPIDRLSKDCRKQFEIAKKMGVKFFLERFPSSRDLSENLVIDALLGTGLGKPVRDDLASLVKKVNRNASKVLSVDIPTGISSDTGEIMGSAINADFTVTFGLPKLGHLLYPGAEYTGRLFIEDIGFPKPLLETRDSGNEMLEMREMKLLLPERKRDAHKGDFGHVLVVGGSTGKSGAVLLAAKAALRSGSGLVTIGVPERVIDSFMASVSEEMTLPLPSTERGSLSKNASVNVIDFLHSMADVLAIGPGMGRDDETVWSVMDIIKKSPVPVVIDADALNALSTLEYREIVRFLERARSPVVLTPHPGEMARLLKTTSDDINRRRLEAAVTLSGDTGCYVVLKGAPTVISAPDGKSFINTTGNPGMATAGTGDVLAGMIASMIGQGFSVLDGTIFAVFLHGLAGDIAAARVTENSLKAGDLIDGIPCAYHTLIGQE
jgi:NAD(P)H-hydrate epimerase